MDRHRSIDRWARATSLRRLLPMERTTFHRESGQAIVEAALILPMWVGCLLGVLQLVLLQEARLLAEYAAYQAARSGIVRNGDPEPMLAAARFVLSPTACPSRSPEGLLLCRGGNALSRQLAGIAVLESDGLPSVRLLGGPPASGEVDFDRIATTERERRDGLLTIELQYWFELKIPFADSLIWNASQAASTGPEPQGLAEVRAEAARGRYFVPIVARHVMRLQSNRYPHLEGEG